MRTRAVRIATALVLLPLLAALACRRQSGAGTLRFPRAPIVLVTIDTLRSDHLPAYGYRGVETPAIDAFRRDALLWRRAYSQVPLTLPSHVSILSGELPTVHGVRDNVGYPYDARRFPSLAVLLRGAGYRTGAAVSAYVVRPETGLGTGFDFYDARVEMHAMDVMAHAQRPGRETVAAALRWLDGVHGQPFFLWVHLYEPHAPYTPPEPFASRYRDPYDGEIATADAAFGELVAGLKRLGVYDRAVVALLSDHGEGLREHGEQEHGILLYREDLQVPLLLKLPAAARGGGTVEAPAQLVDVFPTLLGLVGVAPPPGARLPGRSLLALPARGRELYAETWYPRLHFGWSELTSLVRDRYHYIQGPHPELFDLERDAGERHSVLEEQRRDYAELRQSLAAMSRPLAPPAAADRETAQRLAALGYAAGTVQTAAGEALPDPRLGLASLADFDDALRLASAGRCDEATPRFAALVQRQPRMLDAWEHLGDCLQRQQRLEEARTAFRRALELSGGAGRDAASIAAIDLALGRLDEAQAHAELALAGSAAAAHNLLAQVAIARRQWPQAEREARASLAAGTPEERARARLSLAIALFNQQRLPDALATIDAALAEQRGSGAGPVRGLHGLRGELLARAGRSAEAAREYEAEIAGFPDDPRPYVAWALLAAADGDLQQATAVLARLVDRNDSPAAYVTAVRTLRMLGDSNGAASLLRRGLTLHPDSKELRALAG